jgi:hypothetical protein
VGVAAAWRGTPEFRGKWRNGGVAAARRETTEFRWLRRRVRHGRRQRRRARPLELRRRIRWHGRHGRRLRRRRRVSAAQWGSGPSHRSAPSRRPHVSRRLPVGRAAAAIPWANSVLSDLGAGWRLRHERRHGRELWHERRLRQAPSAGWAAATAYGGYGRSDYGGRDGTGSGYGGGCGHPSNGGGYLGMRGMEGGYNGGGECTRKCPLHSRESCEVESHCVIGASYGRSRDGLDLAAAWLPRSSSYPPPVVVVVRDSVDVSALLFFEVQGGGGAGQQRRRTNGPPPWG